MTDEQILTQMKLWNYTSIYIPLANKKHKQCGPGFDRWARDLAGLSYEQREQLVERIQRRA